MKIYTRRGDKGTTFLMGGKKVDKGSKEIELLGCLDELNASLGLIISVCKFSKINKVLLMMQNDIFMVGAEVARIGEDIKHPKIKRFGKAKVKRLESFIDNISTELPELKNFILPGGSFTTSLIHYSRGVSRRTERAYTSLNLINGNENIQAYLNRASDLLFTLARYSNKLENVKDTIWKM